MAQKLVRTLYDRLKIIEEIQKNAGEKRVDIAKQFGLPTSTLNTIHQEERDPRKLPIKHHANSKAWMTTEMFCSFLHSLDTQMGVQKKS
jgi:hypothetical protein